LNGSNPGSKGLDGSLEVSTLKIVDSSNYILEVSLKHGDALGVGQVVYLVKFDSKAFDEFREGFCWRKTLK